MNSNQLESRVINGPFQVP